MIKLKFKLSLVALFVSKATADCYSQPYFSVQGGPEIQILTAVVDVDDFGDVVVAGYATNINDSTKSAGFINFREGVSCLMAWQRTYASTSPIQFRAVKIELQQTSATTAAYQWAKVHASIYQKSQNFEIFMTFDAAGNKLYSKAVSTLQTSSHNLVGGIQILAPNKFLFVSDTRIQKLDAVGNYFYTTTISPVVKRVRYAGIVGTSLLIASTTADAKAIVGGINLQSVSMVDTDLNKWEQGLAISHGYGTIDVDIKIGIQGGTSPLNASVFMCSNGVGQNLVPDDPLTVKDESKTDSMDNTIVNPGIYFDFVQNLQTISSFVTVGFSHCHSAVGIGSRSANFVVTDEDGRTFYLITIDFLSAQISSQAITYTNFVQQQSLSDVAFNLPFIKTAKSSYTYGFTRSIADTAVTYNLLAVIDLGTTKSQTTLSSVKLDPMNVKSTVLAGGAVASKVYLSLVNPDSTLPTPQPQDYWTTAYMWEPYLVTISKGASNYPNLGILASQQDTFSIQSLLRFQKDLWTRSLCPQGVTGANLPQSVNCWLVGAEEYATCSKQSIDTSVLSSKLLQACFPRRIDHATLNFDYKNNQQLREPLQKMYTGYQYSDTLQIQSSGLRSAFTSFLFTDTQEYGVAVQSYGDTSILTTLTCSPWSSITYWIPTPIAQTNSVLELLRVFKIHCSRFGWDFSFISSGDFCKQVGQSGTTQPSTSKAFITFDAARKNIFLDKSKTGLEEFAGNYLVHVELAQVTATQSVVYSFDTWITVGTNPKSQPVSSSASSSKPSPIYRTHANPYSPININYEWPIYYELNKQSSPYQMTPPETPFNLSSSNLTIPGYSPDEFSPKQPTKTPKVSAEVEPTPIWTQQNIGFLTDYPNNWTSETLMQAQEEAYQRYIRSQNETKQSEADGTGGAIVFASSLQLVDGLLQLQITWNQQSDVPSYLKPQTHVMTQDLPRVKNATNGHRSARRLYTFDGIISLQDSRTQLQSYMATRPTQLIEPAFRSILEVTQINQYFKRENTFGAQSQTKSSDDVYAVQVAAKVKEVATRAQVKPTSIEQSLSSTTAYNKDAELELLKQMEMEDEKKDIKCLLGYKFDAIQRLCLKDTHSYPSSFPLEKLPPKLLPLYFGELTDMVKLHVYSASENNKFPAYTWKWEIKELDPSKIVIDIQIDQPTQIGLSDYIEVSLDFSKFDENWQYYQTGLITSEATATKVIRVSLNEFNLGTNAFFFALHEVSRVIQDVVLSFVIISAVYRLFVDASAFKAFVMMGNLMVLVHVPLLGLEFPKLAGEIMKPLIAVAKLDLRHIANKKLPDDYQAPLPAEFTHHVNISSNTHVEYYLDALYGSSLSVVSTQGILVLYLISAAAFLLSILIGSFGRIKSAKKLQIKFKRLFVLNFPLRLTLQAWIFLILSALLNFWTTPKIAKSLKDQTSLVNFSYTWSALITLLLIVNQIGWVFLSCLPKARFTAIIEAKNFYKYFGAIFDGMHISRNSIICISLQMLKRSFFVFSIFILRQHFGVSLWFQLFLNCLASMGYLLFLIVAKPFESRFALGLEVFGELSFVAVAYAGFNVANGNYTDEVIFDLDPYGFNSFKQTQTAGFVIISGMLLSVALQVLVNSAYLSFSIFRALKQFQRRGQYRTEIESDKTNQKAEQFTQTQQEADANQQRTPKLLKEQSQQMSQRDYGPEDDEEEATIYVGRSTERRQMLFATRQHTMPVKSNRSLNVISESDEQHIQIISEPSDSKEQSGYFVEDNSSFQEEPTSPIMVPQRQRSALIKKSEPCSPRDPDLPERQFTNKRVNFTLRESQEKSPKTATYGEKRKLMFYQQSSSSQYRSSRSESKSSKDIQIIKQSDMKGFRYTEFTQQIESLMDAMNESNKFDRFSGDYPNKKWLTTKSPSKDISSKSWHTKSSQESSQSKFEHELEKANVNRKQISKINRSSHQIEIFEEDKTINSLDQSMPFRNKDGPTMFSQQTKQSQELVTEQLTNLQAASMTERYERHTSPQNLSRPPSSKKIQMRQIHNDSTKDLQRLEIHQEGSVPDSCLLFEDKGYLSSDEEKYSKKSNNKEQNSSSEEIVFDFWKKLGN